MSEMPQFVYHPDPVATGSVVPSSEVCPACGAARGYAYALTPYAIGEHDHICPWCIADGTAHAKFDATFVDDWPLQRADLPDSVVAEVTQRTPGYTSWQQEEWLSCCGDACEFHGDAPQAEIRALDARGFERLVPRPAFKFDEAPGFLRNYEPGGSPAFYKFVCRRCGGVQYGWDCD